MKIITTLCFTSFFIVNVLGQIAQYPMEVESILKQSGKNRAELEKAILHFGTTKDTLKLKAVYFLIANMNIHSSANYYWADSLNKPLPFNELSYPTFEASLKVFEEVKKKTPGIHPVPVKYWDIDSIKGDFLIDNVERAFEAWKKPWAKSIPFDMFCEYILPYRISIEPLQNWRSSYMRQFESTYDSISQKIYSDWSPFLKRDLQHWFTNTYGIEGRKEPLPRLGAMQLLFRKKGPCEDIADLEIFILRSQGFPATIDYVPYWATSSGKHWLNVSFDQDFKPHPFDAASPNTDDSKLEREPAKVLRTTFSAQKGTVTDYSPADSIPEGFMRHQNYLDVTSEYWQVKDVKCALFPSKNRQKVVFACVFNYLDWRPAWWGLVKNDSVNFTNMCKGAVYLPMDYRKGKLKAVGYPIVSGYTSSLVLKPDIMNKRTINIREHEKILAFRPGKKYSLYYWENGWKGLGAKIATKSTIELVFENVPKNALLLLIPEYSQHKERPFMVTDAGERVWW